MYEVARLKGLELEAEFKAAVEEIDSHTKATHQYCECGICHANRDKLTSISIEIQRITGEPRHAMY